MPSSSLVAAKGDSIISTFPLWTADDGTIGGIAVAVESARSGHYARLFRNVGDNKTVPATSRQDAIRKAMELVGYYR